jgi:hypothetical protein
VIGIMQEDDTFGSPLPSTSLLRAAEYVRMSTEHQQYSTENQAAKIREYAERRGIGIVRTYADEGKSGLRIDGRRALQQLIKDVEAGTADFQIILVYDVSRWGRFQDADESAYYEYICRRAGIQVAYCAEQFENDGSPVSTIVKGVKRAMAGEYTCLIATDDEPYTHQIFSVRPTKTESNRFPGPVMRHLLKKTILNLINHINQFFLLISGPPTSKKPPLNGGHHADMGSSIDCSAT